MSAEQLCSAPNHPITHKATATRRTLNGTTYYPAAYGEAQLNSQQMRSQGADRQPPIVGPSLGESIPLLAIPD